MVVIASATRAALLSGPRGPLPDTRKRVVDLQSEGGVTLVGGEWRYGDARTSSIAASSRSAERAARP